MTAGGGLQEFGVTFRGLRAEGFGGKVQGLASEKVWGGIKVVTPKP